MYALSSVRPSNCPVCTRVTSEWKFAAG